MDTGVKSVFSRIREQNNQAFLYRGNTLQELSAEISGGSIDGNTYTLHYYEIPQNELRELSQPTLDEIQEYKVDEEQKSVTGGVTGNLGTSYHFSSSTRGEIPGIAFLDTSALQGDIMKMQYTVDFFMEYPVLFAHADTLKEAVVVINGEPYGNVSETDVGLVSRWSYLQDGKVIPYEDEEEYVVVGQDQVSIGGTARYVGAYTSDQGGVATDSIILKNSSHPDAHRYVTSPGMYEKKMEIIHSEVMSQIGGFSGEVRSILFEDSRDLIKGADQINSETFIGSYYNGMWDESYPQSPYTG